MTYQNYIKKKKLKTYLNADGDVKKFINNLDPNFTNFGEVYFSFINKKKIKSWKMHKLMTMNLCVPYGLVKFVFKLEDKKNFYSVEIGKNNYSLLTVKPGIWFGFQGLHKLNLLCNMSNILHNDNEVMKRNKDYYNYAHWEK